MIKQSRKKEIMFGGRRRMQFYVVTRLFTANMIAVARNSKITVYSEISKLNEQADGHYPCENSV